jgi:hypothetical protein
MYVDQNTSSILFATQKIHNKNTSNTVSLAKIKESCVKAALDFLVFVGLLFTGRRGAWRHGTTC